MRRPEYPSLIQFVGSVVHRQLWELNAANLLTLYEACDKLKEAKIPLRAPIFISVSINIMGFSDGTVSHDDSKKLFHRLFAS